jgi:hypothetical protein
LVTGRPRRRENQPKILDGSIGLEFCCHNIRRSTLAEALDDMIEVELAVPKGKHGERISYGATATLDDIIRGLGMTVGD